MKKFLRNFILVFAVVIVFPVSALEQPLATSNDSLESDFYLKAENNVELKKDVNGSSLLAGDNVNVNKNINGIGFIFGNNVKVNGNLEYGFTAGNNVAINGLYENDAIIFGNIVTFNNDSKVGRDAIIFASTVTISGNFERNVKIFASEVIIKDANILGNVRIHANNIEILENSVINGKLSHNDTAIVDVNETAAIGEIVKFEDKYIEPSFFDKAVDKLVLTGGLLLVFAVFALTCPKLFEKLNKNFDNMEASTPFVYGGIGAISLLFIPIIVVMLFITIIGLPLGLVLTGLYLLMLYLSALFTGYLIGRTVNKSMKKEDNILLNGLTGMLVLYVISLIPFVSTMVAFIKVMVGFGIVITLFKKAK